jgi:phage/plasmid-like protein (TIGR03299 family)
MSADVEKMFSVRESVWWQGTSEDKGQASILGDHPKWEDARILAGLDWDPQSETLHRPIDVDALKDEYTHVMFDAELSDAQRLDRLVELAAAAQKQVEGWKHVHRSDTIATLACTMDSYEVITNSDFGGIFDAVLGQDNVKFETGGCLEGGKRVWMLAKLDEPMTLPGDSTVTYPFMALMSRHDAMGATVLRATNVRIVCKNTFNMAEMAQDGKAVRNNSGTYSFVHRGDWHSRVEEARTAVSGVRAEARAYVELSKSLLLVKVNKTTTTKFINTFIPAPPDGMASDRVLRNVETSREKLAEILASPTVAGAGIGGTAYGLIQGAGEYLDHARQARTWETKLNRSLLRPEPLKARALSIVRELTEDSPKPRVRVAPSVDADAV